MGINNKQITTQNETILLLGNYRPTLALAKQFKGEGYKVIAGLEGWEGGAQYSKYVDSIWDHPDTAKSPDAFLQALLSFCDEQKVSIVFPVAEEFVRLLAKNTEIREQLPPVVLVSPTLVEQCLDKFGMLSRCTKLDVPTAPYGTATSMPELEEVLAIIGYPAVIRPEASTVRINDKKAITVTSKEDLLAQLPVWPASQGMLICQAFASGLRHNAYFAAKDGKVFRFLHAKILRTDVPDGSGLAVEGITLDADPTLRRYTEALVADMNYTGIGCAQYLVDDETGAISFLEINARIAGNHCVPEATGLKLGQILVDLALNKSLDTTSITGKGGMRYAWFSGELMGIKIALLRKQLSAKQAVSSLYLAVVTALRADLHMTFSWQDPKPGIMALFRVVPSPARIIQRVCAPISNIFKKSFSKGTHQQ
ncbi:hypothetical protein E1162_03315 [Rhodobacteraceae bacterium RKSG542]|uniref:ATP-binding protein n=1 Tax=Pseudovibrio flavus TaxID=2529854 RepID=UPI0012BD6BCF|nr:hypothetical protein [Pseudovibrio flavus]MTI16266.1 hypothetical protein [Pseudovibrio flavus]